MTESTPEPIKQRINEDFSKLHAAYEELLRNADYAGSYTPSSGPWAGPGRPGGPGGPGSPSDPRGDWNADRRGYADPYADADGTWGRYGQMDSHGFVGFMNENEHPSSSSARTNAATSAKDRAVQPPPPPPPPATPPIGKEEEVYAQVTT